MKFNKTNVFLTLFGLFLVACLACSVKAKFHEAMTCKTDETPELEKMSGESGVFDPDVHVDAKYRDRPKKASLSFMDPLKRVEPEGMKNREKKEGKQMYESEFGLCSDQTGAPMKADAAGSNCYGFCPDNASIYKTDAAGTNCYGYCVANNAKSPYKTDAAGTNCFGMCPDGNTFKTNKDGTNCVQVAVSASKPVVSQFGWCPDGKTYKTDSVGSNCVQVAVSASKPMVSQFGWCPDGKTYKTDSVGSNCVQVAVSASKPMVSQFGMCPDGKTFKTNKDGTNCVQVAVSASNPVVSQFGWCPDGKTYKTDSVGSNCSKYPAEIPQSCIKSPYGCCPGTALPRNQAGTNCAPGQVEPGEMYPGLMPYNTTTVFIPPPAGVPAPKKSSGPKPAPKKSSGPKPAPKKSACPKPAPKKSACPKPAPKKQACSTASTVPPKSECPAVPNGWAVPGASSATTMEPTSVQGFCPAPPPCPACARCPESAFECKKVPNYNRATKDNVPQAVLPNFSSFGM